MLINVAPGTITYFDDGGNAYYQDCDLMQFTGLLDKNGKEIYEGDIMLSGNGRIWVIKYGDWKHYELNQLAPMFGWYASGKEEETEAQLPLRYDVGGFMEVFGNLYENPDLLA